MSLDLVTIASFRFIHEAELAKARLEEEDIAVFIADAEIVGMNVLLGEAVGYIKLQVPRTSVVRAKAILERPGAPGQMANSETLPDSADMTCLACGKPMAPEDSRCGSCGWSYQDK